MGEINSTACVYLSHQPRQAAPALITLLLPWILFHGRVEPPESHQHLHKTLTHILQTLMDKKLKNLLCSARPTFGYFQLQMTENSPQYVTPALTPQIQFYLECHFFTCLAALHALQTNSDTGILIRFCLYRGH